MKIIISAYLSKNDAIMMKFSTLNQIVTVTKMIVQNSQF